MGDRRCPPCCAGVGECLLLFDDFERTDSSDLGSDWNEVSGDWSISSGRLTNNGGGVVMTTARNTMSRRGHCFVTFYLDGSGPWEFDLIVGADSDGSNGQRVTIEMSSSQCTLTANDQSKTFTQDAEGGKKPLEWLYPSSPATVFWRAVICYTDNTLYVSLCDYTGDACGNFHACIWDSAAGTVASGRGYAGIETVAGTFEFEWYYYYAHRHDFLLRGEDHCYDCICACGTFGGDYAYVPWKIRVDFFNDSPAGCPCFDGGYMILEVVHCQTGDYEDFWICVEGDVCGSDMSYLTGSSAKIDCGTSDEGEYVMTASLCEMGELYGTSQVVCDPFSLRWDFEIFDPLTECSWCSGEDPDEFYAIATDAT